MYSGANAGEIVERFNRQLHQDELEAIAALAKGNKEKEARLMAASCRKVHCISQESLNSDEHKHYEALMAEYPSTREEDAQLDNYWIQKERYRTGNYPAFAGYESLQLFTYTAADKLSDSETFARDQWVENLATMTKLPKNVIEGLGIAMSVVVGRGKGKTSIGSPNPSHRKVTQTTVDGNVPSKKAPCIPNAGAVGNMGEFFRQPGFGSQVKSSQIIIQ